ncbi:Skp1-Skp2-Cks1 in complex with A P27 peptide, partial [Gamsiella multidivaricata]|uniref:Skp1-Skp2-Cks1 in complex with A P27 peptide n=1 Tax=Gamsiella multidivaricata TaxID=101098 RepID=UPI00221EC3CD
IVYGDMITDDKYEYRHIILPKYMLPLIPPKPQWRAIYVQMSPGWVHYMRHDPEPHIMLFRR